MISENIAFNGPMGTIEGKLITPTEGGNFPGVVICHPHSMMGGNMDNNVVLGISSVLTERGYGCLIFNFRGVGKSQGKFDDGLGEVDDTLAAISFLASINNIDPSRIFLVGYSFGAGVAMNAASNTDINKGLALIGRARVDDIDIVKQRPEMPILFVVGDRDRIMSADEHKNLIAELDIEPVLSILTGTDHFLLGMEKQVGETVADFFDQIPSRNSSQ